MSFRLPVGGSEGAGVKGGGTAGAGGRIARPCALEPRAPRRGRGRTRGATSWTRARRGRAGRGRGAVPGRRGGVALRFFRKPFFSPFFCELRSPLPACQCAALPNASSSLDSAAGPRSARPPRPCWAAARRASPTRPSRTSRTAAVYGRRPSRRRPRQPRGGGGEGARDCELSIDAVSKPPVGPEQSPHSGVCGTRALAPDSLE